MIDWENTLQANMAFTTYSHVEFVIPAFKRLMQNLAISQLSPKLFNDIERNFLNVPELISKQVKVGVNIEFEALISFLEIFILQVCPIQDVFTVISNVNISIPNYDNKYILSKNSDKNFSTFNIFFDVDKIKSVETEIVTFLLNKLVETTPASCILTTKKGSNFSMQYNNYISISQGYSNYKVILSQLGILDKGYIKSSNYAVVNS